MPTQTTSEPFKSQYLPIETWVTARSFTFLLLKKICHWFFKFFHLIEIHNAEHVPSKGAVIIASNHPSYFDPALIMLGLSRPVRFLAWEKLFQVPLLGFLMKRFGAIAVDIKRPGRASFEAAVRVLQVGEAFGIFPEGGRSEYGVMNPVKSGVARLALITGAPIVPVTITGAFQAWSKHHWFPRPWKISVTFHSPIALDETERRGRRRDPVYEQKIVDQVVGAINQKLIPSVEAEKRFLKRKGLWKEHKPYTGGGSY